MKYDINISKDARQDLSEIYKYITETLLSPQTGVNQLNRIEKGILSLDICLQDIGFMMSKSVAISDCCL